MWGLGQLVTGGLSDRIGRKRLIVWGMWMQAVGIALVASSSAAWGSRQPRCSSASARRWCIPTLLAAIGDVAHPSWRASAVGVYRLWRDLGYAIGALLAGITADAFGVTAAIWLVALLTFALRARGRATNGRDRAVAPKAGRTEAA